MSRHPLLGVLRWFVQHWTRSEMFYGHDCMVMFVWTRYFFFIIRLFVLC